MVGITDVGGVGGFKRIGYIEGGVNDEVGRWRE